MAAVARTLLVAFVVVLAVLLGLPCLLLWTVLTRRPDFMYGLSMKFCRLAVPLAGIRVRVEGLESTPPRGCVFAANHASNLDPVLLLSALPRRVSIFAKRELFRIPIFSAGMRLAGFIPVDRGGREALAGIATAVQRLGTGLSLAIFPEGTRSPDGRVRPFKKGALAIAMDAGVPVVPVSIAGTQRLLPKGNWIIRPGEVIIRLGPAVDASGCTPKDRPELLARLQSLVAAGLPADQQPSQHAPPQSE